MIIFCTQSFRFGYLNLNDVKKREKEERRWKEIATKKKEKKKRGDRKKSQQIGEERWKDKPGIFKKWLTSWAFLHGS